MLTLASKMGVAGAFAAVLGAAVAFKGPLRPPAPIETVDVAPRPFVYRVAGDFSRDGRPTDAPLVTVPQTSVIHIMKQQVTAAAYDRCVADGGCLPRGPSPEASDKNLPAVQVSWQDATAYAAWLSAKTGETWRLPTDEEWALAAGSRFHDDALSVAASRDPSVRWLARYEKESEQEALDQRPRPSGAFGANEYGLLDLSGNVWEWTNTGHAHGETAGFPDQRTFDSLAVRQEFRKCVVEHIEAGRRQQPQTAEHFLPLVRGENIEWIERIIAIHLPSIDDGYLPPQPFMKHAAA